MLGGIEHIEFNPELRLLLVDRGVGILDNRLRPAKPELLGDKRQ